MTGNGIVQYRNTHTHTHTQNKARTNFFVIPQVAFRRNLRALCFFFFFFGKNRDAKQRQRLGIHSNSHQSCVPDKS